MPPLGPIDRAALRALSSETFGHAFAKFLDENNLNPEDLPDMPGLTDESYVRAHLFETHDIWHIVTGFDTSVEGELGLQAFYLAQFPAPLAAALLAAGFLNMALYRELDRPELMDAIVKGWGMGRRARQLFGMRWAEKWDMPLSEIRSDLEIEADLREVRLAARRPMAPNLALPAFA